MEESEGRLPEPKGGRRVASIGTWETLDARCLGGEPTIYAILSLRNSLPRVDQGSFCVTPSLELLEEPTA